MVTLDISAKTWFRSMQSLITKCCASLEKGIRSFGFLKKCMHSFYALALMAINSKTTDVT